jgi:hypothetical protein
MADVPLDVDASDVPAWEQLWRDKCKDAKIASESDISMYIRWLHAKSRPGAASDPNQGVAQTVIQTLEAEGVAVTSSQAALAQRAVLDLEAGDELNQCTSCKCVFLLYLGILPSEEEREWYENQQRGASKAGGGAADSTIDITRVKSYTHAVNKTGSLILSRALLKPSALDTWLPRQQALFNRNNLQKAAGMLMRVESQARLRFQDDRAAQLRYLQGFFFDEFMGRGMPSDFGEMSAASENARELRVLKAKTAGLPVDFPPTPYELMMRSDPMVRAGLMAEQPGSAAFAGSAGSSVLTLSDLRSELGRSDVGSAGPSASAASQSQIQEIKELKEAMQKRDKQIEDLVAAMQVTCRFCERAGCNGRCRQGNIAFDDFKKKQKGEYEAREAKRKAGAAGAKDE